MKEILLADETQARARLLLAHPTPKLAKTDQSLSPCARNPLAAQCAARALFEPGYDWLIEMSVCELPRASNLMRAASARERRRDYVMIFSANAKDFSTRVD